MNENVLVHSKIAECLKSLTAINQRIATLQSPDMIDLEALRSESLNLHKLILSLEVVSIDKTESKPQPEKQTPKPIIAERPIESAPETPEETYEVKEEVTVVVQEVEMPVVMEKPQPEIVAEVRAPKTEKKKLPDLPHDENPSVNDKFVETRANNDLAAKFNGTPITDLKKAISISKKFEFINGLFNQNHELYTRSIHTLNSLSGVKEAESYLKSLADQDLDLQHQELMEELTSLVRRRYMS